jgi:hypothetical protein
MTCAPVVLLVAGMTREVTFAMRTAYKVRHGISTRNRVRLYLEGNFLAPITRSSPGEQELILYPSPLVCS